MSDFDLPLPLPGITQAAGDARYLPKIAPAVTSGALDLSAALAGQIIFPAAPNLSANANTFDAYEEGETTVAYVAGGGGTITIGATNKKLYWTRRGNRLEFNALLDVSAIAAPAGELTITPLPFLPSKGAAVMVFAQGLTAAAVSSIQARVDAGVNQILLRRYAGGASPSDLAGMMQVIANLFLTGSYPIT